MQIEDALPFHERFASDVVIADSESLDPNQRTKISEKVGDSGTSLESIGCDRNDRAQSVNVTS